MFIYRSLLRSFDCYLLLFSINRLSLRDFKFVNKRRIIFYWTYVNFQIKIIKHSEIIYGRAIQHISKSPEGWFRRGVRVVPNLGILGSEMVAGGYASGCGRFRSTQDHLTNRLKVVPNLWLPSSEMVEGGYASGCNRFQSAGDHLPNWLQALI